MTPKIDLNERFDFLNLLAFGGAVPKIPVEWSTEPTRWASTFFAEGRPAKIMITRLRYQLPAGDSIFSLPTWRIDALLLHEMTHALINQPERDHPDTLFEFVLRAASDRSGVAWAPSRESIGLRDAVLIPEGRKKAR